MGAADTYGYVARHDAPIHPSYNPLVYLQQTALLGEIGNVYI